MQVNNHGKNECVVPENIHTWRLFSFNSLPPTATPPTCQDTPGYASYFSLNTLVYEISLPLGISFLG